MDTAARQIQNIQPHSIEAEQSVLGSMLLDNEAVAAALEELEGQDFYLEAHKEILRPYSIFMIGVTRWIWLPLSMGSSKGAA